MVNSGNQLDTIHHRITTYFVVYRNKKKFSKITRNTKGFLLILNDSNLLIFKFWQISVYFFELNISVSTSSPTFTNKMKQSLREIKHIFCIFYFFVIGCK